MTLKTAHRWFSPDRQIDRESPMPFYFQLAEMLKHDILAGRLSPGSRLPSEPDIGTYLGVSRTTVRQALARLEQEGLVSRRKGHGTYVDSIRPRSWLLQSSGGFFEEEVLRMGGRVKSEVLRLERIRLPGWVADDLGLERGSQGVILERLRWINDLVAMFVVDYVPPRLAEAALSYEASQDSFYALLKEQAGVEVSGGWRTVEAVCARKRLATLLEVPPRRPLAFIESVSWDQNDRPLSCYQAWLRTDRMVIEIQVTSASSGRSHFIDMRDLSERKARHRLAQYEEHLPATHTPGAADVTVVDDVAS